jgi:hypothetical protein
MMLGIIPISFRFRGKLRRLALIYDCFQRNSGVALHPAQIARQTSISLTEANNRLSDTPEMFIKLPKRPDGLTRYRLSSAKTLMTPEEVEKFLILAARKETLLLYAAGGMVFCLLLIVVIVIVPILQI